jgi:hypothetical protein
MEREELLHAAARNLAAWHESNLRALGIASVWAEEYWECLDPKPVPAIYHRLVTLAPAATAQVIGDEASDVEGPLSMCDSWADIDMSSHGFVPDEDGEWFVRPAGHIGRVGPRELSIEKVTDEGVLAEFEKVSIDGFESPGLHELGRGGLHAPGILDDEAMHVLIGRFEGKVVTVAMAYVSDGVVGVFGVATLPRFRRRGYGAAMTWDALNAEPELPSMLQPSPYGRPGYIRLGYRPLGTFRNWIRPRLADSE